MTTKAYQPYYQGVLAERCQWN